MMMKIIHAVYVKAPECHNMALQMLADVAIAKVLDVNLMHLITMIMNQMNRIMIAITWQTKQQRHTKTAE
jgi:hypothetical protein